MAKPCDGESECLDDEDEATCGYNFTYLLGNEINTRAHGYWKRVTPIYLAIDLTPHKFDEKLRK